MIKRDLPGYAIGGLAGDELKDDFWKIVDYCTSILPKDKPRLFKKFQIIFIVISLFLL